MFLFLLRHLALVGEGHIEVCTSMPGMGQGREAELPGRFEGKRSEGLGRGTGASFKMVWVLPTPAKEPGLWRFKAMLFVGGANTEVWGHGLCTNTGKVNSSW